MTDLDNTAPRTLTVRLGETRVRFTCNRPDLMAYAAFHLLPSLVRDEMPPPAICARLRWHDGHPPKDPVSAYAAGAKMQRLDRDLFMDAGQLIWSRVDDLRDLHLRFHWDGSRLEVEGDYYHRLSKNQRVNQARRLIYHRRLDALRRRRFTTLLYYMVYYPAFWWLEHKCGIHPLHGAAVDLGDEAVVLAGPSGVGKSTLAVALAALPGARFMSDTFVLHRGRHVWAVPEPALLDRWSREWLGDAAETLRHLAGHPYVLGREGYSLPAEHVAQQAKASVVAFPRRAPNRFVHLLGYREAMWRIDAYNDIVNDLRRYRAVAAVLELLGPTGLPLARVRGLEQLAAATRCYEIGLTSEVSRAEAVRLVVNLHREADAQRQGEGSPRFA